MIARRQRHTPEPSNDYRAYRACLRWDSGFTCCFCLVHESDLDPHGLGIDGQGLTSIEHLQLRSTSPELENEYRNLAYACRFCNNRRATRPMVHESGARLLDPWRDAWGEHFVLREDRLEPIHELPQGRDAHYTAEIYQLNDRRKVAMRKIRREFLEDRLAYLDADIADLYRTARKLPTVQHRRRLLQQIRELEDERRHALSELRLRRAVPRDAPGRCRCGNQEHHSLPSQLPVREIPA